MQPKHPTLCRRAWFGGGRRDFPPDGPYFRLSMLLVTSLLRSLCPKTYTFNTFLDVLCSQNQTPFWARVAFSVPQNIHFQLIPCCFVFATLCRRARSGRGQARFSGRRSTLSVAYAPGGRPFAFSVSTNIYFQRIPRQCVFDALLCEGCVLGAKNVYFQLIP